MSDLRAALAEIERLLPGATAAPWQWLDSGGEYHQYDELQDGGGEMVASGFRDDINLDEPGTPGAITDGRLCAAMRNAMPLILAATTDSEEALSGVARDLDVLRAALQAWLDAPSGSAEGEDTEDVLIDAAREWLDSAAVAVPLDAPADAWLLFFEDPDHVVESFVGAVAEEGAWRRYRVASQTWNCTLFRAVSPDIDRHTKRQNAKP